MAAPYLSKTKAGLGWVLAGLFFLTLPGFVAFGKLAYVRGVEPLPSGEGWVSIPGYVNSPEPGAIKLSKLEELNILAYGGPILLGGLLCVIGRVTCGAVPTWSGAKGLFLASGFFTLVVLAAAGTVSIGGAMGFKETAQLTAPGVVVTGAMAEIFFILGLCAIGSALKRPRACRAVGAYVFMLGLAALVYTSGWDYYITNGRPKDVDSDLKLYEAAAGMLGWLVVVGSAWRAVSTARWAIRDWSQEIGE